MIDKTRYISVGKDTFYDTKRQVLVEKAGDTMRVVSHDRRREKRPIAVERREVPTEDSSNFLALGNNIFFDKVRRILVKKLGAKMVLFSRDRRKIERRGAARPALNDRRKTR